MADLTGHTLGAAQLNFADHCRRLVANTSVMNPTQNMNGTSGAATREPPNGRR